VINISIEVIAFLFVIALVASFLDTLAGGGGLLTVPALIVSGVPPLAALGTNKLQSVFGSGTASYLLARARRFSWQDVKGIMLGAFIGSLLASALVQFINSQYLQHIIPAVLVVIAIYFLVGHKLINYLPKEPMSTTRYQRIVIPLIGAYDGMLGPGTGSFYAAAGVALRGLDIIKATALAKPMNFASNIASLLVFAVAGQIWWAGGAAMIAGQLIGATAATRYLYRINATYLRLLIVFMCVAMLVRYGMQLGA
jgi:uncharacterized membrane protein YfcA